MRHLPRAIAPLVLVLAACQAAPGVAPDAGKGDTAPKVRATKAPAKPSPSPATSEAPASARPTASAVPSVASQAPLATLLKPATATRTFTGVVRIDAAYAVSAGGAGIVSNNGGTAVAAPGQLVSNNSGNLIANNGGVISNNGGSLVGNNSAGYAILQAAAAASPAAPGVGTILPAAGMVLQARSLRTSALVPVGVDGEGEPVTAVLTNAAGGFELYLPEDEPALLFEARFPGEGAKDQRLSYDLLPTGTEAELVIDEDTAQVTRYVREACLGTVVKFVMTDDVEATVADIANSAAPSLIEPLTALVREFRGLAVEVGLDAAPQADRDRVSRRMNDAILSHLDLASVMLLKAYWPSWEGPEEPAIPALVDVMRRVREASTAKLVAEPGFFDAQTYLATANATRPAGKPPYAIAKPADLNELVVQGFVVRNANHGEVDRIFASIGVDGYQSRRMYAAVNNYIALIATTLFADVGGAKTEALGILRDYRKATP